MRCLIWFFRVLIVVLAVLFLARALHAQDVPPTFDVASVKANRSGGTQASAQLLPDGVNFINLQLRAIIQLAYGVTQASRVVDGPGWIQTERFDIVAKAGAAVPGERVRTMLQALLAERFGLVVRRDSRQLPALTLVRARADGPLGPQLKPFAGECANQPGARGAAAPQPSAEAVICGPRPGGPGRLILAGSPISQLASLLGLVLMQTIVDQTGLAGRYDLELTYVPEIQPGADTLDRPSVFTALEEQLGLKLESRQDPVEVLVIERVSRPTEN
jgi:uncharacterized protein (TIGR03435 family)